VRTFILFFLTVSSLLSSPSLYDQGKRLYFANGCNGCHGISAGGTNQYPPLAYRRKAFLEHKLKAYRAKQATTQLSQMMIPFALTLTDTQINALTTFFSQYNESSTPAKRDFNIKGDGGS
jgi:cytochrome c553